MTHNQISAARYTDKVQENLRDHWRNSTSLSDMKSFTIKVNAISASNKFQSKIFYRFISPSKLVAQQTTIFLMQKWGFTDIRIVGVWEDR